MTILVTGTTGLVGARLLPRLMDASLDCRALVRSGKDIPDGVTAVEGDILDPASLLQAVQGVSAIVHLAAVFRTPDTDLIWKSNLEGTRNLIAAAKMHSPEARFIMSSTSNVYDADIKTTGPTAALFCALELNRLSPKRFQLSDLTLTRTLLRLGKTTKRELRRSLKVAWGILGRDPPAPSNLPPIKVFLTYLHAIWDVYCELDGTGDEGVSR